MSDSNAARAVADRMSDAAQAVLAGLDGGQRERANPPWTEGTDAERRRWFYTPTDHGGLTVATMTATQYRRTMALVATGLSEAAYVTVTTIMGLENVLDRTEGFARTTTTRERWRDPQLYYLRIFGNPGDAVWGWRFGGHHVSLNNLVVDGSLVSSTPCFLGADPAGSPLLGGTSLRPLGGVEDLGRALLTSLDDSQRSSTVLTPRAPLDVVGANRPRVEPGNRALPLGELFGDRFTDIEAKERMNARYHAGERRSGLSVADHDSLELTVIPKGVPAARLNADQRALLVALLDCYTGRVPEELTTREAARFAGPLLDEVHFAWAGSDEPGAACYYRLQGPRLLVEYDNAQRHANHAHSVWRDPEGDFGSDVLAAHRRARH
jgi:hypothetical protein